MRSKAPAIAVVGLWLSACGIITFVPDTGPDVRHAEDSTPIPKPTPFYENCFRHITAAHEAMRITAPDSMSIAATAHAMAMHEYHARVSRQP